MEHLAIDLGGRESQICVRNGEGQIVEEQRCRTSALPAYLAGRGRSRVVVETCSEAFWVADAALAVGHEVRVVPATLVRSLGVGARRLKTDRRDARVLSEVSCRIDLPSVHVPSPEARQRKTLCGMREALVGARTKVLNTVRGWLRAEGRRPRGGDSSTFAARVRELYAETRLPGHIERQLRTIDALTVEIADADHELALTAKADPIARRLMTVPGVGPATAVRFVAALDEISRFSGAHAVESYLGSTDPARPWPPRGRGPRARACEPYRDLIVDAPGRGRNGWRSGKTWSTTTSMLKWSSKPIPVRCGHRTRGPATGCRRATRCRPAARRGPPAHTPARPGTRGSAPTGCAGG